MSANVNADDSWAVYCDQHIHDARIVLKAAGFDDMREALVNALEFIEDQEDVVDGSDGEQEPNRAMQIAQELRAVLAKSIGSGN